MDNIFYLFLVIYQSVLVIYFIYLLIVAQFYSI